MSDLILTKNELYQVIKKRKIETDQIDGKNTEEDINELIINNETDKSLELFNKVFSEEEDEQLIRFRRQFCTGSLYWNSDQDKGKTNSVRVKQ